MNKMILAAAALVAATGASAAVAQYGSYPGDRRAVDDSFERRLDEIRFRIDDGERRGRIGPEDAVSLRDELIHLRRVEALYARRGLGSWERDDLQRRLVLLRDRIRYAETVGEREPAYGERPDEPWAEPWNGPADPGAGDPPYEDSDDRWQESVPEADDAPRQDDGFYPGGPDVSEGDGWDVEDPEDEGFDDGDWEPI